MRMTVEIISQSISTKVWDQAGIEPATPGSAVRLASVARHVTDCAMRLGHCPGVTLNIRGSSPKSKHLFPSFQKCFYASLLKIHPLVQKITHGNPILDISKSQFDLEN